MMNEHNITPVSIATAEMRGWWVEMRASSFLLCGPNRNEDGVYGYFERCPLGYRFPAEDIEAAWESMREASRWFRREWRPDFALSNPFGLDRGIDARLVGDAIELHCTAFTETGTVEASLQFTYTELPALRAALARRARPRRKRQAKEHDANPQQ